MIRFALEAGRLRVQGHAGYAPKGADIVCAGVSALVGALEGYLTRRQAEGTLPQLALHRTPDGTELRFAGDAGAQGALDAVELGLTQIAAQYPEYVQRCAFAEGGAERAGQA